MESNATSKFELPDRLADASVRLGQEGYKIEIRVAFKQPVEQVVRQYGSRRFLVVHGVERGRVHALRDHHGPSRGAPGLWSGVWKARRGESNEDEEPKPRHRRLLLRSVGW